MARPVEHGTNRGYQRHMQGRTRPCFECSQARLRYNRGREGRAGVVRVASGLGWPLSPARPAAGILSP
jgi:hypothetical protein